MRKERVVDPLSVLRHTVVNSRRLAGGIVRATMIMVTEQRVIGTDDPVLLMIMVMHNVWEDWSPIMGALFRLDAATLANVTVEAVAFAGSYGEAVLNGLAPKMGGVGGSGCGLVFLVDVQGGAACCTAVLGDDMMSRIAFIATPSATSSSAADDSGTSVGDAGVVKVVVQCMRMAHERLQEEGTSFDAGSDLVVLTKHAAFASEALIHEMGAESGGATVHTASRSSFDVIVDLVVYSKESSSEWLYRSEFEAHRAAVAPSGEEKVGSENEDTNELANALLKKFFLQHGVHHPRFYPSYP